MASLTSLYRILLYCCNVDYCKQFSTLELDYRWNVQKFDMVIDYSAILLKSHLSISLAKKFNNKWNSFPILRQSPVSQETSTPFVSDPIYIHKSITRYFFTRVAFYALQNLIKKCIDIKIMEEYINLMSINKVLFPSTWNFAFIYRIYIFILL